MKITVVNLGSDVYLGTLRLTIRIESADSGRVEDYLFFLPLSKEESERPDSNDLQGWVEASKAEAKALFAGKPEEQVPTSISLEITPPKPATESSSKRGRPVGWKKKSPAVEAPSSSPSEESTAAVVPEQDTSVAAPAPIADIVPEDTPAPVAAPVFDREMFVEEDGIRTSHRKILADWMSEIDPTWAKDPVKVDIAKKCTVVATTNKMLLTKALAQKIIDACVAGKVFS